MAALDTAARRDLGLACLLFALMALPPFLADTYILRLGTTMLMYAVLALSWNFIGGMAGYPSFATAAFLGWAPMPVASRRNSVSECGSHGASRA